MKIYLILVLLIGANIFAKDIHPYRYVTIKQNISDFVKVKDKLYIGTTMGTVNIYDLKSDKLTDEIKLPSQVNVWEEEVEPLISSIDFYNGKLIFVARKISGFRELYIYENKKLVKLINESQKLTIQKIKFINDTTVIMATSGNEILLYNFKEKKIIYKKQLNLSAFIDLKLSEDKKYVFIADVTPLIYKIELKNGNIVEKYYKANKRDIFSIDYKNNKLLTGGKDRRVVLYSSPNKFKVTKADFFIYAVALNPKATKAAYVNNEESEINIIDTKSLRLSYNLKGHKQNIVKIDFHKQDELITADKNNQLFFWKLN